jgi:hypothetical protein
MGNRGLVSSSGATRADVSAPLQRSEYPAFRHFRFRLLDTLTEIVLRSHDMKFPLQKWLLGAALLASGSVLKMPGYSAETRDVLILAGQSNAVGYDALPSDLPADANDADVLFWWRCGDPPPDNADSSSGKKWSFLQVQPRGNLSLADLGPDGKKMPRQYGNFKSTEGGYGPEMGMARELLQLEKKKSLAVIKVAFSGTGVRTDWNPEDAGSGGACYRALLEETRMAVDAAKTQGIELRLRAFAWVQGESDANPRDALEYETNLGKMLETLRRDLKAPEMSLLLSVNPHFGNDKNPLMKNIVDAQRALGRKMSRCVYVDNESAETLKPQQTHFTGAGTLQVGRSLTRALLALESGKESMPNP